MRLRRAASGAAAAQLGEIGIDVILWRTIANQQVKVRDLRIEQFRDEALRRYVRTAKLLPADAPAIYARLLPELLDVRIVSMSPQAFTLSGFERIDGVEYALSWLVAAP